ncbi:MAG: RelA/SpoT family protein [Patescibacteria group bacterium]
MNNIEELYKLKKQPFTEGEKVLLKKAYDFAVNAHAGQKRDSGELYFTHAFETAKNLTKLQMDAETIAAGFLHDTVEDTETTEEDIKKEFGEEIAFLVKGITKLSNIKYRGDDRHVESLRKFFLAMARDLRVVIIKLADRLHNAQTLEYKKPEKQKRIALETIEIHARLADRLGMGKLKGDLENAAFPYAYPKEYAQVEEIIKEKKDSYEKNLAEVSEVLKKELLRNNIKVVEIDYRIKHKYSLYKKLLKYGMDLDKIYDVVALRVVVDSIEDCYRVLGLIHSIWNPLPGRIKDFIAIPKPNGYRSIHTTVFTGLGGVAEIQIRTKEMHTEAAYGIAAHFAYKEQGVKKTKDDKDKFKWIEELKELNYSPGDPKSFIDHLKMDFFNNRIFIFTPKGDVVDLPEDSSPIDFAYSIHTDIGNHISGAKINSKMSHIFTKLKNGDIVEIITKKDSRPSSKWLEYVKTSVAKKHIKSYLEKNSLLSKLMSFGRS